MVVTNAETRESSRSHLARKLGAPRPLTPNSERRFDIDKKFVVKHDNSID